MKAIFLFLLVCLSHFGHTQQTTTRVSQNPKADSLYQLAIEFGYREQFKSAISYLDSAIQLDSNIEHVFFDRGVLKEHIGDTSGAIQDFTTQIQLDKKDADAAKALNKKRQFQRKSKRCRLLKSLLES